MGALITQNAPLRKSSKVKRMGQHKLLSCFIIKNDKVKSILNESEGMK